MRYSNQRHYWFLKKAKIFDFLKIFDTAGPKNWSLTSTSQVFQCSILARVFKHYFFIPINSFFSAIQALYTMEYL